MKVIKFPVNAKPELLDVPNELHALQKLVGGHIQHLQTEPNICLLVDEEGRLKNLPFNCWHSRFGNLYGTVICVGVNGEDFCDVPQDYIDCVFTEGEPDA